MQEEDIIKKQFDKLQNQLIDNIKKYLDSYVIAPAIGTIKKDLPGIDKLGSILIALRYSKELIEENGIDFDKSYLNKLPLDEINKRINILGHFVEKSSDISDIEIEEAQSILKDDSSKKHLLSFLNRELNWVTVSILSASYLSAQVLLRSSFELLIGISTRVNGPMNERIESIEFLLPEEQKVIKKLWRNLCGWGHPYGKWEKEVCTIYYSHAPKFHPALFKDCLEKLEIIIGFFLITTLNKYEINDSDLLKKLNQSGLDFSDFPLLGKRVQTN